MYSKVEELEIFELFMSAKDHYVVHYLTPLYPDVVFVILARAHHENSSIYIYQFCNST